MGRAAAERPQQHSSMGDVIEIAKKWVISSGWDVSKYNIQRSAVQSCPEGYISVDVTRLPEEDMDAKDQYRQSRVLEIDLGRKEVDCVLAGREPKTFNRLLELEKTKNKTAEIQAQLEAQEKKRAEKGVVDDESS